MIKGNAVKVILYFECVIEEDTQTFTCISLSIKCYFEHYSCHFSS